MEPVEAEPKKRSDWWSTQKKRKKEKPTQKELPEDDENQTVGKTRVNEVEGLRSVFLNFFLAKANSKHKQELVKFMLLDTTVNPFFTEEMAKGTPLSPVIKNDPDGKEVEPNSASSMESPLMQVPKRVPGQRRPGLSGFKMGTDFAASDDQEIVQKMLENSVSSANLEQSIDRIMKKQPEWLNKVPNRRRINMLVQLNFSGQDKQGGPRI